MHSPLKKEKVQDPPIEHDLYATLEEIYHGCVKKMKISRRVLQPDGTSKKEDKYVSISIKPGWKSGTKVTFQKEGDQSKGKIPADIVFIVRDKPHVWFRREGSDLRYTARLTLKQVSAKLRPLRLGPPASCGTGMRLMEECVRAFFDLAVGPQSGMNRFT